MTQQRDATDNSPDVGSSPAVDFKTLERGLFFVVGSPRSGTTLVRAFFCANPRIFVPPETKFFIWFEPPKTADGWPDYLQRLFHSRPWANRRDRATRRRTDVAVDESDR